MQTKFTRSSAMAIAIACYCMPATAQLGIPPPEQTTAIVNTHYAQHEDFRPGLVSRLKVPAGYQVTAVATGLVKPRMMALSDDRTLYITRRDAGDVLMLKNLRGDIKFDQLKTVVTNFRSVHGITIHDGWLYLCSATKLARGRLNPDGSVGVLDTLINDMPDGSQHDNRTIAFGPDGKLYITVGSDCNDCNETNPEHATILQANADGSNRIVYARNLRNTLGFDWHPTSGELWGMDHGTDWRGDSIPPEELNKIIQNGDYGWPLVYGKQVPDYTREDPIGTTKEAYAKTTQPAILTFAAHSAPMDFRFMRNSAFPEAWRDDALVAWHGSWNRKNPEGFKVQRLSFDGATPQGTVDFLSGFLKTNGTTSSRFGRPVGIAITTNGMIFISDDANGVIYCVSKPGQQNTTPNLLTKK
jgi:glucose/arabinose dehydrogenase